MPRKQIPWQGPDFLKPYRGSWVAVAGQEVLVHGESAEQVRAKLRILRKTAEDVLLVPGGKIRWEKE
jgi:hypothetical protein